MKCVSRLVVLALVLVLVPWAGSAQEGTYPADVLEEYWQCMERHDLDQIQDLLWYHHNVERVDASVYGLPKDDFDDRSLLTIQERLDVRARRAAAGVEMATSGPLQYPHHMRHSLAVSYTHLRAHET